MPLKTVMRYHSTSVRVAISKMWINNKHWQGCKELETHTLLMIMEAGAIMKQYKDPQNFNGRTTK